MRRGIVLLFGLPLLFLGIACSGHDEGGGDPGKLRVVAVTTQIGDFARNVGGDHINLSVLLKPNQDAHDFEPEPSQIRSLSSAALVLRNGLGMDEFLDDALSGSSGKVVTVTDGIRTRNDEEGEADPHVWFAVANARSMVNKVRDALAAADTANAAVYAENATKYLQRLDELDAMIKREVDSIPAACRKLVTNHDVLGYFAQAYGFTLVGSVIPSASTDARASAADVADAVRKIRAERVPAIFAESEVNPALIKQVGREANVKVVDDLYGDSLGKKGSDGATYTGMMEANTRKIAAALRSCPA